MKRFLLFVFSLILTYFILVFGAKLIWAQYLPKSLNRDFIPPDVHTIVIGASNGECSWDDSIITWTKNLCSSGFTNLDAYYELQYCLDYNTVRIDTVILCQSLLNFLLYEDEYFYDKKTIIGSEPRALLDYEKFYETYRNCADYFKTQISSVRWIKSLLSNPYGKGFLHLQRNKMTPPDFSNIKNALMKYGDYDGFTSERIREHCSLQIDWLESIRDLCRDNGITLILYSAPVYRVSDMVNDGGYYKLLGEVLSEETLVADYSRFEMPGLLYYADPAHLNYKGAQLFSSHIASNGIDLHPISYYLSLDTDS